jgi:hypothetical protein
MKRKRALLICSVRTIVMAFIFMTFFIFAGYLKNVHLNNKILEEINSEIGSKYEISNNISILTNNSEANELNKILKAYKLIYEINLDCAKCLFDLKEIYNFYLDLCKLKNDITLCLVTPEKSVDYIKFFLDKILQNYTLCIIHQEKRRGVNIKIYLLDASDNIIMAGDILKYPSLKSKYIRELKKRNR